MSNASTSYTDVIVVGAGPAGLMSALALCRLGLKVRIIDRRLPGESAGQADGIQPRTTEIWDSFGLGDELRRLGTHVHKTVIYNPNDEGTGIKESGPTLNIAVSSTRYPFEVLAPIAITEGILRKAIGEHGVKVEEPVIPISIDIDETTSQGSDNHPIQLTIAHLKEEYLRSQSIPQTQRGHLSKEEAAIERTEVIQSKFVVGGDGAHSWVRKSVNIAMEGEKTELSWGVIDFTPLTDFPTPWAKNIIQSPLSGAMGYLPRPNGTARMYILLKDPTSGSTDVSEVPDKDQAVERRIIKTIQDGFSPFKMEITDVTWANVYKVAQRVAARFSHSNRVFIAGDACHTHSPKSGQGANTSMTDACNLAWKIAYVIRGWAKPTLLDSYEAERRPYSFELIEFDKEIFKLFNPAGVSPEEYTELWRLHNMFTTGIGLKYSSSLIIPESQELADGLRIGERFPPGALVRHCDWNPVDIQDLISYNGKFKMMLFPGDITQPAIADQWEQAIEKLTASISDEELRMLDSFLVFKVPKETTAHKLRVPSFVPPKNVFMDDGLRVKDATGSLYREFGITGGVVALVRPDGHICLLLPLEASSVLDISKYLHSL
ncbi:hypothetical protein SERLA73DRAFT_100302 [Serpula lacrymans var. lacrymans S7.3]|uniref:FAD-binding domain-containing protein n=1 Tax=Serpula lacrymans var. lacrymans (strain S7.3) TaxID=936435 RepID=F8QJD2_SERL3|nr:hypothetical protein SERLA73DRAFT_100302 [Serpula lacrymans var. lacrymans S7.3]